MKILFIAETLTYGGAARRFVELANALANRKHTVTMLLYNDVVQISNLIDKRINVIIDNIENKNMNWIIRNIFYRYKCIKLINTYVRRIDCDIVISFNDMVNINVLLSKEAAKKKRVISERCDPYYNKLYLQLIKKMIYKRANGIVFQTQGARDFFGSTLKSKNEIISNPLPSNIKFNKYNGTREKTIVSVARLWIYQKRQDVLLYAFKEFSKTHNDYTLILYGDGPDESKIYDMIKKLDLEKSVFVAGAHDNVIELIKNASVFVLSSDFEGMPNALIEAMAIGLPVVSTDCSPGGARFLINNGINGLIVERSNYLELAKAISYMIENPDESNKMGINAMQIIDLLNENKIYDDWERFLLNI